MSKKLTAKDYLKQYLEDQHDLVNRNWVRKALDDYAQSRLKAIAEEVEEQDMGEGWMYTDEVLQIIKKHLQDEE